VLDAFTPKLVKMVFFRYTPLTIKGEMEKRETVSFGILGNEKWKACSNIVI
jgi:hypothetical protein